MALNNFSLFLGLRYLKPKRTFVSVITLISIFGVILGVALLLIVTSVMSGFERDMKTVILGSQPHLIVRGEKPLDHWPIICEELEKIDNIEEATPFVMGDVVVDFNNLRIAPKIHAIAPKPGGPLETKLTATVESNTAGFQGRGKFDLDGDKAIVGAGIANQLGLDVGDTITILSPKGLNDMLGVVEPASNLAKAINDKYQGDPKPDLTEDLNELNGLIDSINSFLLPREVEVAGIFDSGHYEYNNDFIFIPLYLGQELYDLGPTVHGITIQTNDPYLAHQTKLDIIQKSPPFPPSYQYEASPPLELPPSPDTAESAPLSSDSQPADSQQPAPSSEDQTTSPPLPWLNPLTWMDMNRQIFNAVNVERRMLFLLLFSVIIVAGFCIMNTMITVTVQKRREIGVMKAIGARVDQIIWVFLSQGLVVGALGTLLGLGAAFLVLHFRNELINWLSNSFGLTLFPADVYGLVALPSRIVPSTVAIAAGGAMLICALAALLPAYFAARLDPAKALRNDQ